MAKRNSSSKPDPFKLIQELHAQLKKCDRLPPPWDAFQTDDPSEHHNLSKRIVETLRISSLGTSRHSIKLNNDSERFDFFPDRVWAIKVMPSFHNYGQVVVFEGRSHVRCAIACKGNIPDQPDPDYVIEELFCNVEEWDDPVLPIIKSIELAPEPDRSLPEGRVMLSNDGISYSFSISTPFTDASIQFSNPRTSAYRKLEQACYNAAKRISRNVSNPRVSNFVKIWKSYTDR